MKVVFKIANAATLAAIAAMVARANEGIAERGDEWYYNHDQVVVVDGNTVIVEGQRCALWQDYYADVMKTLRGLGVRPIVYESSDKRLAWDETLSGYIATRATDAEVAAWLVRPKRHNDLWCAHDFPAGHNDLWGAVNALRKRGVKVASAAYDNAILTLARVIEPSWAGR